MTEPARYGLTPKQKKLLSFIERYISANDGISPSFTDMATAMDLKSKSGIHRLVSGLEERGYIHKLPSRARTICLNKEGVS